ncbi:MAG: alpha/beta fold hydrolase [Myxococcota bacterium]
MPKYPNFYARGQKMTFAEIHALCSQSYNNLNARQRIAVGGSTWIVESEWEHGRFAAYLIRKPGGWRALVFRGTDDYKDWVIDNAGNALGNGHPPQYRWGSQITRVVGKDVILVGHSLGGGIATYASAHHGNPAVTIFPAPVIPSSLPKRGEKADVVNYVCDGEVLSELASGGRNGGFRNFVQDALDFNFSWRIHRRLGPDWHIQSRGGNSFSKHYLTNVVQ